MPGLPGHRQFTPPGNNLRGFSVISKLLKKVKRKTAPEIAPTGGLLKKYICRILLS